MAKQHKPITFGKPEPTDTSTSHVLMDVYLKPNSVMAKDVRVVVTCVGNEDSLYDDDEIGSLMVEFINDSRYHECAGTLTECLKRATTTLNYWMERLA